MGLMTINCLDGKALRAAGFGHQKKREMLTTADREWILPEGPPKRALHSAPVHIYRPCLYEQKLSTVT